jgi:hypothetical protein
LRRPDNDTAEPFHKGFHINIINLLPDDFPEHSLDVSGRKKSAAFGPEGSNER